MFGRTASVQFFYAGDRFKCFALLSTFWLDFLQLFVVHNHVSGISQINRRVVVVRSEKRQRCISGERQFPTKELVALVKC